VNVKLGIISADEELLRASGVVALRSFWIDGMSAKVWLLASANSSGVSTNGKPARAHRDAE
jgi:hypothetical protein